MRWCDWRFDAFGEDRHFIRNDKNGAYSPEGDRVRPCRKTKPYAIEQRRKY
jgi:hypothetical protein